jgi:hypothetical protein
MISMLANFANGFASHRGRMMSEASESSWCGGAAELADNSPN